MGTVINFRFNSNVKRKNDQDIVLCIHPELSEVTQNVR